MPTRSIARRAEAWFRRHQRKLPWRATYDPYHVWLSEVMLQQTRMEVVLGRYDDFLRRFPTIEALARSSDDDVTAAWSGLGYYRRARMLRSGAVAVVERFGGALPATVDELMTLDGIGRYTAGAISSIAYDRPAPIVDGNIARIVSRLFATHGSPWKLAESLVIAASSPRIFNQALMEIGALICKPKNPQCSACPLRRECVAFRRDSIGRYPRPTARKGTKSLRIPLFVITDRRGRVLMRRERGRLMNGMLHLPHGNALLLPGSPFAVRRSPKEIGRFRHTITNRRIEFVVFTAANGERRTANGTWVDPNKLDQVPHPSYVRKALRIAGLLLFAATALFADAKSYEIRSGAQSTAQFHAEDSYDSFDGKTDKVSGNIDADAANPGVSAVEVSVDLRALETGVALRDHEMRDRFLQAPKFPAATFKSISVAAPPSIAANQPEDIKVSGDFTLHGVTRRMTIPVRVVLIPDGRIHATSQFNVHMPDFGIDVPSNLLVTVNHDVPVRLDIWAVAK